MEIAFVIADATAVTRECIKAFVALVAEFGAAPTQSEIIEFASSVYRSRLENPIHLRSGVPDPLEAKAGDD